MKPIKATTTHSSVNVMPSAPPSSRLRSRSLLVTGTQYRDGLNYTMNHSLSHGCIQRRLMHSGKANLGRLTVVGTMGADAFLSTPHRANGSV